MEIGSFIGLSLALFVVFGAGYYAGKENTKNASWLEARKYEIDKQAELAREIALKAVEKKSAEQKKED